MTLFRIVLSSRIDRSRTPEDGRCSARCPRHTEDEIFHLGRQDLMALSDFLADNPFSMGDTATTLDATAYGLRVNVLWYPIESALKVDAESFSNLNSYCEGVRDRYFAKEVM